MKDFGKVKVVNSVLVGEGNFAVVCDIEGKVPDVGSVGYASIANDGMSIEVVGISVVDPNLVAPGRQGLLVKLLAGDEKCLDRTTFEFNP